MTSSEEQTLYYVQLDKEIVDLRDVELPEGSEDVNIETAKYSLREKLRLRWRKGSKTVNCMFWLNLALIVLFFVFIIIFGVELKGDCNKDFDCVPVGITYSDFSSTATNSSARWNLGFDDVSMQGPQAYMITILLSAIIAYGLSMIPGLQTDYIQRVNSGVHVYNNIVYTVATTLGVLLWYWSVGINGAWVASLLIVGLPLLSGLMYTGIDFMNPHFYKKHPVEEAGGLKVVPVANQTFVHFAENRDGNVDNADFGEIPNYAKYKGVPDEIADKMDTFRDHVSIRNPERAPQENIYFTIVSNLLISATPVYNRTKGRSFYFPFAVALLAHVAWIVAGFAHSVESARRTTDRHPTAWYVNNWLAPSITVLFPIIKLLAFRQVWDFRHPWFTEYALKIVVVSYIVVLCFTQLYTFLI